MEIRVWTQSCDLSSGTNLLDMLEGQKNFNRLEGQKKVNWLTFSSDFWWLRLEHSLRGPKAGHTQISILLTIFLTHFRKTLYSYFSCYSSSEQQSISSNFIIVVVK
jgi:hypothetical protein